MCINGLRHFMRWMVVIGLVLSIASATVKASVPGSAALDPTFDGDGKLLSGLGSETVNAQAVAVQADQKLVVAGSVLKNDHWDFIVLRYCADGSLDDGVNCGGSGFGTNGRVVTNFGGDSHDSAMDVVLQLDGKIVVAGTSSLYPQFDMAVARYNPDGSLDTTFDSDGLVKVDFNNSDERGYAVALQVDGKIILGGVSYITTFGDFALARLCPNGALDNGVNCGTSAFSSDGWLTTDFAGSADWVDGLAVYDGKIIAGGSGGNKDFAVARYTAEGVLDNTFSSDGKQTVSFGTGWDYGQDVLVQSDGKIILAGGGYAADWNTDFGLVRFNLNGDLDTTFSGDGKVLTEFFGYSDRILSLTMHAEQIVAVGYAMHCYGEDWAVARYDASGSLVASFGVGGKLTTDFGGNYDAADAVAVQSDGKIIAVGGAGENPNGESIALARYSTEGILDTAFGGDGKVITDSGGGYHLGYSVAASSAKILVAGWANNTRSDNFALARFLDNGALDTSFSTNGVAVVDFSAGDDRAAAMAVQPDGKLILAGYTLQGGQVDFALARFCANGMLDEGVNCGSPGFGVGGKVITDFGGNDYGQAVLIQPGGAIVVAGTTRACPNSDFAVARYTANGVLDASFSGDGKTTVDFSGNWDDGGGLARQTDGKLILAGATGTTYSNRDFALIRLCANGSLDDGINCGSTAFGAGGKVITDFAADTDKAVAVAVQPDGKIVAAGDAQASGNDFAIARYCANGLLDDGVNCGSPAFGMGGKTTLDFFDEWDTLSALLLLPRGKILVSGYSSREILNGWDKDFGLALFNPNGSLYTGFSGDGLESLDFGSTEEQSFALAQQADGKLLVCGESSGQLALARFIYPNTYVFLPVVVK